MPLYVPGRIGKVHIKNRIVMAPMGIGGLSEPDGRIGQRGIDYYVTRAKGGVGLIITGATYVSRDIEYLPNAGGRPTVDGTMYIASFNELADAVHDYGAKIFVQLSAGKGRIISSRYLKTIGAIAPSAVPCYWDPEVTARELSIQEIETLIRAFGESAALLRSAGVDGVEIHAHNGYLPDQFLTSLWNKRTDEYGGDLKGRMRFSVKIIEEIKRRAGGDFPVIYRFGLTHYLEGGREVDEGLEIARELEKTGVDAFDIDAGCFEVRYWATPPESQPAGCMVDMAQRVKHVVHVPVIAVGKLGYPDLAMTVLREGKADFIALGRPLLADPNWPNKVMEGRQEEICPCIGCYKGCQERINELKYISCAVTPATGNEREFAIKPAKRKKTVLVIGGGPAGMEAARVAILRGHDVTLWEKGDALGGALISAAVPDFKQDYKELVKYLSTQVSRLGVDIVLGKDATPQLVKEVNPEVVFVATGAIPIIPEIPGAEKEKVSTAVDILLGKVEGGKSVVIIGGGLVGCETGLHLAQQGKKVTIIEMMKDVASHMFYVNRMHLLKLMMDSDVEISTETEVLAITDEGVSMANKDGKEVILGADTVIIAAGLKSDRDLLEALHGTAPKVYAIGDCVEPRLVMNAIWEGFRTARLI